MTDEPPKKGKGKGCLIVAGVIGGLVVLAAIFGGGDKNATGTASAEGDAAVKVISVTARELSAAFQENEAKAKLAYDGSSLRVTGKVKDIDLDFADKPVIKLAGSGDVQGMGVSANGKMTDVDINGLSNEDAANVSKGAEMSFLCKGGVNEVMGSPQLADCSISQP